MSTADYLAAVACGKSEPLKGASAGSPWEPDLAEQMRATGRAVMEERFIPSLLSDLRVLASDRVSADGRGSPWLTETAWHR